MADSNNPKIPAEVNFRATGLNAVRSQMNTLLGDISDPALTLAAGGTKAQVAWSAMRGIFINRVLGPLALISGAVAGVGLGMRMLIRNTQLYARGIEQVSRLEFFETQFKALLGGVQQAKARIKDLFQFAATTPFQMTEVAEASRVLEVLTKGALSGKEGLRLVGDAAAVTGRQFQDVAFWIGRLYDGLKSGRPVGEVLMRLQEMGLVTGVARAELESLTAAGANFTDTWAVVTRELSRTKNGMVELSQTMGGLQTTVDDVRAAMAAAFGAPFLEAEKESLRATIAVTEALTPVVGHLGKTMGALSATMSSTWSSVKRFAAESGLLGGTLRILIDLFYLLGGAVMAVQFAVASQKVMAMIGAMRGLRASTAMSRVETLAHTAALRINTAAQGQNIVVTKAAAAAGWLLTSPLKALRVLLKLVAIAFKEAFAVFRANPIVAAVGAIAVAVSLAVMKVNEYRTALKELRAANDEVTRSILEQIEAMRTRDNQRETAANIRGEIAKAQEQLGDVAGLDMGNRTKRGEIAAHINRLEALLAEVESRPSGTLAGGEKEKAHMRAMVDLAKEMKEIRWQAAFDAATEGERLVLLKQKELELAKKVAQAEANRTGSAELERESAAADARVTSAESLAKVMDAYVDDYRELARLRGDRETTPEANRGFIDAAIANRENKLRGAGLDPNATTAGVMQQGLASLAGPRAAAAASQSELVQRREREMASNAMGTLAARRRELANAKTTAERRKAIELEIAKIITRYGETTQMTGIEQQHNAERMVELQKEIEELAQNTAEAERVRTEHANARRDYDRSRKDREADIELEQRLIDLERERMDTVANVANARIDAAQTALGIVADEIAASEEALANATDATNQEALRARIADLRLLKAERLNHVESERLALLKQQRELEEAGNRVAVERLRRESAAAAGTGQYARADALRREADALEEQQTIARRTRELGGGEAAAAQAQAEAAEQRAIKDGDRKEFTRRKEEEVSIAEARAQGDRRGAQAMRDRQKLAEMIRENMEGGMNAQDASAMARRELDSQMRGDANRAGVVASSLQAVGGGGGSYAANPLLTVAQRQEAILKQIRDGLTKPSGSGGGGAPPLNF